MYLEVVTDQHRARLRHVVLSWLLAMGTLGYLFPYAVATTRGKANAGAIGVVNLALGWTIVGWIVALALACGRHRIAGLRVS